MSKELNVEEVKDILSHILFNFKEFCEANNLKYFLAYGTLIGAVRHQDFIPWDDDIDVVMPRDDYDKFLQLTKDGIGDIYSVVSTVTDNNYIYPFAKMYNNKTKLVELEVKKNLNTNGIYIDIFPLDGMPEGKNNIRKHYKKAGIYIKMNCLAFNTKTRWDSPLKTIINRTIARVCRAYGCKRIIKRMDKLSRKYDYKTSEKVGLVCWGLGEKEAVSKDTFSSSIQLKFRNDFYNVPVGYHEYLTSIYGDYMEVPPKECRVSNHNYKAYYLNHNVTSNM